MPIERSELGRLIAVFGVSPLQLQRAAGIAVLSFLFFLAMMVTFYLRQVFLYFLLATGFLVVYLFMMFSIFSMRRSVVRLFENGIEFRKHVLGWSDISAVRAEPGIVLETAKGKPIALPASLVDSEALKRQIEFRISGL